MIITAERLTEFSKKIFESLGATQDKAWQVAHHLVEANLKGHDSHGVGMIPRYVYSAKNGDLKIDQDAELVLDKGSVLLVDGQHGFGQVVARQATQMGIERARTQGIACVGSKNNYHVGRVGSYGEQCAAAGLISIHFVNVVGHPPFVAPWGGRDARMQTNPFCCAVPTKGDPIVLDMATSAIALGKARVARMKGLPVPDGSVFDADGHPSNDPNVLEQGGTLSPFGEHKGFGLALICELLGGGLAGEWTMADVDKQQDTTINNMLMFIVDPDVFGGAEYFEREVESMIAWLKSAEPAVGNDYVRLPGEPERESLKLRQEDGIPIDDQSWASIVRSALKAGMTDRDIEAMTS